MGDGGDAPVPAGYEFQRVLGSGGFGEVVLARQVALDRLVAVKRIHSVALADQDNLARFRREARLLAGLACPSVVHVYDLIVGPRQAYLVMEFVPGQPLSQLLERGPLPATTALVVLADVAEALAAGASQGIVHRDVKPHNVFVLPDGRAKLGDFGLARAVSDPGVFRTSLGTTSGTPAYFPPELGTGEGEPDERSDAYSFGVMAYETLTGRRPYEDVDAIALITAHWMRDPPDPRTILPGLPAKGASALLAGMTKDPARRPSPLEQVRRLQAVPPGSWPTVHRVAAPPEVQRSAPTVLTASPGSALPPPTSPSRVAGAGRRLPVLLALTLAAVSLLVVGVLRLAGEGVRDSLSVEAVRLTTEPVNAVLQCPRGNLRLIAVFTTNGRAGTFDIRWSAPGSEELPDRAVRVDDGQTEVVTQLELTITGRRPLRGAARVVVVGVGEVGDETRVTYRC